MNLLVTHAAFPGEMKELWQCRVRLLTEMSTLLRRLPGSWGVMAKIANTALNLLASARCVNILQMVRSAEFGRKEVNDMQTELNEATAKEMGAVPRTVEMCIGQRACPCSSVRRLRQTSSDSDQKMLPS